MGFRRRRFRSTRRGGRSRRIRWDGQVVAVSHGLDANPSDYSWLSFWVKDPASMQRSTAITPPGSVATNEPVDETLVRLFSHLDVTYNIPGTAGAAPIVNIAWGIIPWQGGEVPDFYDGATFSLSGSLVAPPHPIFQIDDPWVWRSDHGNGTLEVFQFSSDQYEKNEWVRSMRKLPAGVGLLCVIGVLAPLQTTSTLVNINAAVTQRYAVKSGFSV